MRIFTIASGLLAAANLAHAAAATPPIDSPVPAATAPAATTPAADSNTIVATDAEDAANKVAYRAAVDMVNKGQPAIAVAMLDKLIPRLEKRYAHPGQQIYCGQSQTEVLAYMLTAAADKRSAVAVDAELCSAYFHRAYANVDLGKLDNAQADLERALALAPKNPHYLSEMAALHTRRHEFNEALALYHQALDLAPTFSAEGRANAEQGVALRGIGYVLVELGNLDEAEAAYRRCLEIDPDDRKAQGELEYIQGVRERTASAR